MSDLISRQAAIDAVRELYIQSPKINNDIVYDTAIDQAHDALVNLPSAQPEPSDVARDIATIIENEKDMRVIAAQPEIIYCGDCKYKDDGINEDGIPFLKCLHGRSYGGTRINDFCSWAERRTDG